MATDQLGQTDHTNNNMENSNNNPPIYPTSAEYCKALNNWITECNRWYTYHAMFPYFLAQNVINASQSQTNTGQQTSTTVRRRRRIIGPNAFIQFEVEEEEIVDEHWSEYKTACVWKRLIAEIIDYALLFVIKLFITFLVADFLGFENFDKYLTIMKHEDTFSYEAIMEITTELIILEFLNRIIICLYEALFLKGPACLPIGPGGATPGKVFMGLKVIACLSIADNGPDPRRIKVRNAEDLGFMRALGRSLLKNFTVSICLPTSITVFFIRHQRAVYDVMFNCIVVEDVNSRDIFPQHFVFR